MGRRPRRFKFRNLPGIHLASYFFLRSLIMVVGMLPSRQVRRAAALVGAIAYLLDVKHRRIAIKNVLRADGMPRDDREVRAFVRRVYEHLALYVIETLRFPSAVAREGLDRLVRVVNRDHLVRPGGREQGAIVVIGHLGNWELVGLAIAMLGVDVHAVARPIENPYFDAYLARLRSSTGTTIISKYGAFRSAQEVVKAGGRVVLLADQDARKGGVFVPFLGRPASTVKSPALLSLKYRAPIVPCNIYREPDGCNVIEVAEPIWPGTYASVEQGVRELTAAFTAKIEEFVRARPAQWMWLHARWKTKPREAGDETVDETEGAFAQEERIGG